MDRFREAVKFCVENGCKEDKVRFIASDLESTNVEFLYFIQSIGPHLIDTDKNIRINATKLLSEVITKLKPSFFNEDEVHVLLEFLCAKFTDHHIIAPASLKGVSALAKADSLTPSSVKYIVRSIFKDLMVQTLIYSERSIVYSIFDFLLRNHLKDLKEMGGEFVMGFVQMVDSETDPRNLLMVFGMIPIIAANVPLDGVVEDLFEPLNEYFPIQFEPMSDGQITRDDLSNALKSCFTASPEFADFSIPLIVEKLSSDVINSKLDSLQYLIACCGAYHPDKIFKFSDRIINVISSNVFSSTTELRDNCLSALVAMAKSLSSREEMIINPDMNYFLDSVFRVFSRYLQDTSQSVFHQSIKSLLTLSCATPQISRHLIKKTVDALLKEFDIQKQAAPRVHIVKSLLLFIDSKNVIRDADSRQNCEQEILEEVILDRKDELMKVAMSVGNNCCPDLRGLSALGSVVLISCESLSPEERFNLLNHLVDLAFSASSEVVRNFVFDGFKSLATLKNDLCLDVAFPKLVSTINSELEDESNCGVDKHEYLISLIARISVGVSLVSKVAAFLIKTTAEYCNRIEIISPCTHGLVHLVKSNLHGDAQNYLSSQFISECRELMLTVSKKSGDPDNNEVLSGLASCIRMVVESCDRSLILPFTEEIVMLFLDVFGKQQGDVDANDDIERPSMKITLHLVLASVCCLKIQDELKDINKVTRACLNVAMNSEDQKTSLLASKCFAALINKSQQNEGLEEILQKAEDDLLNILIKEPEEQLVGVQMRACTLWTWITKALVARNHHRQMIFANQMVDMLSSANFSPHSSDGFRVVLADFDDVMSEKSHSITTLMFRQRFFSFTFYRLEDAFHHCKPEFKKHFLEALSHMIRFVPKQAISQELKMILPLLIQSLNQTGTPDRWLSSLSAIESFIISSPQEIEKYLDDIIPRFFEISTYPENMTIRIEALKCMAFLPEHLSPAALLPRRTHVVRTLMEPLADHKRLVRQQACFAKSAWHLISEPRDSK